MDRPFGKAAIPGHQAGWAKGWDLIQRGTLPQVIIFEGRRGLGKPAFVDGLIAAMYCQEQEPCGTCHSCVSVTSHRHHEVLYFGEDGKAIQVADAEAIQEHLSVCASGRGASGKLNARVVVLQHAERLTNSATNRLLKTLEEPPAGSFVFLITSHFGQLLETLRSRGVRWPLRPAPLEESRTWVLQQLPEGSEIGPEAVDEALRRSGYAPLAALHHLRATPELRDTCIELLSSPKLARRLAIAESVGKSKDITAREIVETMELAIHEIQRSQSAGARGEMLHSSRLAGMRAILSKARPFTSGASSAVNKQLLLEALALSE